MPNFDKTGERVSGDLWAGWSGLGKRRGRRWRAGCRWKGGARRKEERGLLWKGRRRGEERR